MARYTALLGAMFLASGAPWLGSSLAAAAAPNAPQEIARDPMAVQVRSCK